MNPVFREFFPCTNFKLRTLFLKQKQFKTILCPPLSRSNWCGLDKSARCDGSGESKIYYSSLPFREAHTYEATGNELGAGTRT